MQQKVVIVTGGNSGLGKATALALAQQGASVVLACRDIDRAEVARAEIVAATGNERIYVRQLDLASFASIREFACELLAAFSEIHVLINNAGIAHFGPALSHEGYESHFGINHLGHFLLTHLLLERLQQSAPARIINVSSIAHWFSHIDFDNLRCEKGSFLYDYYGQSKLANLLFTKALARRFDPNQIAVFALHPGLVGSNLFSRMPRWFESGVKLLAKSPAEGAKTSVYLAMASEVESLSGEYFVGCKVARVWRAARDITLQEKLWSYSARACLLEGPGTVRAVDRVGSQLQSNAPGQPK